ncbi:MAG: hypothetical protein FWF77_04155, partial [Defluviitaleaceae bacterium]|nr:hypothetical protein [Defluviitaleaceae bacterium]
MKNESASDTRRLFFFQATGKANKLSSICVFYVIITQKPVSNLQSYFCTLPKELPDNNISIWTCLFAALLRREKPCDPLGRG